MNKPMIALLVLVGCNRGEFTLDENLNSAGETPELTLEITSPEYGAFLGDGPVVVTGIVSPPDAEVLLAGIPVDGIDAAPITVAEDGTFEVSFPFSNRYAFVDVQAHLDEQHKRVRFPVFDGQDPLLSWPGEVPMQVTPHAFSSLGTALGVAVDAAGWEQTIVEQLPSVDTDLLAITPIGIFHEPTLIHLQPTAEGIVVDAKLQQVSLDYELTLFVFEQSFSFPVSLGFGDAGIQLLADVQVDDAGMMTASVSSPQLTLAEPTVEIGELPSWLFDWAVDAILNAVVDPLNELLATLLTEELAAIPVGGPFAFETDLMGASLSLAVADLITDTNGLGVGLSVGLNEPSSFGPLTVPYPLPAGNSDLVVGVHEGLLQSVVTSTGLLDVLAQDLELEGTFGELLSLGITNLPGGDTAPAGEGWCVTLTPNSAQVARLHSGTAPLGTYYLPDLGVEIQSLQDGACTPWLNASIATEVRMVVTDGTLIDLDIGFTEGAILEYGATSDWNEAEVVDGLSSFLNTIVGFAAGNLSFDLADLAGLGDPADPEDPLSGFLTGLSPSIVSSEPMAGEGVPEGMFDVGIQLWEE